MGKIFCIMGKSATGKDTIYRGLLENRELGLKRMIPYTTRPIRDGELPGREYYFCDEETVKRLTAEHRIVELREYHTVYGIWKYFTVNDETMDIRKNDYLLIGTLESYLKIRDYFGSQVTIPIYIEVEDGERLLRAIAREKMQTVPRYEEMCRRFLADAVDFSEENLNRAGIQKRFLNQTLEQTLKEIERYIAQNKEGGVSYGY